METFFLNYFPPCQDKIQNFVPVLTEIAAVRVWNVLINHPTIQRKNTETDLLTHVTRALSINSFIGSDAMLVFDRRLLYKKNHYRHSHHITIRLCRPHSHWIIYHNQIYTISLLNNYSKITFTFSLIRPRAGDAHFTSQRED